MSWKGESRRHSLARKGIKTSTPYYSIDVKSDGRPKLRVGLPSYSRDLLRQLCDIAGDKEWIAELSMIKGNILIDDIQVSDEIDHSYLRWNKGDEANNVGYIHYHPPSLIPEFSAQDFVLALEIHDQRENKEKYPYTLMGLVYPDDGGLHVKIYAINPKSDRRSLFEGKEVAERDLQKELNMLKGNGELIELNSIGGGL